ncbi:MAG: radical SAM protein [Candidatus Micrarchaeia archaeon]
MAKILLLNPPSRHGEAVVRDNLYGCFTKGKANYVWPPLALAEVAATLEARGNECRIIDGVVAKRSLKQIASDAREWGAEYLFIITGTPTLNYDLEVAAEIKRACHATVLFSGSVCTLAAEKVFQDGTVDYALLGEPDLSTPELVDALEKGGRSPSTVKGISYMSDGEIKSTGPADLIEDLNVLPFPARHLIPNAEYFNPLAKRLPYTTIFTSRGCPFHCIFCPSKLLYGGKFRPRSAENVVAEMEECVKKYGIREFFIRDETFTLDKKRVLDICRLMQAKGLRVDWICNSRVDTIDKEMMIAMKKAGCHLVKYGVESGSQRVLDYLEKGITLERTRQTFKEMHETGIDSVAHFMMGSPGETREDIEATIRFAREIDPDYASFNITIPMPGTELWNRVKDKLPAHSGDLYDIEKNLVEGTFSEAISDIPRREIEKYYNDAHRHFYLRPSYILKRLRKMGSLDELVRTTRAGAYLLAFTLKRKTK